MTRERRVELLRLAKDERASLLVRVTAMLLVFSDFDDTQGERPALPGPVEYFPPGKDPRR